VTAQLEDLRVRLGNQFVRELLLQREVELLRGVMWMARVYLEAQGHSSVGTLETVHLEGAR